MVDEKNIEDIAEESEMIKPAIEALLFAAEQPISFKTIQEIFIDTKREVLKEAIRMLKEEYSKSSKGIFLIEVSSGYQFRTKPEYKDHIIKLTKTKPARLSQSALEVLAIIAYKQPIIKSEIEDIRGVDSSYVIRKLLEKSLIRIMGKKDIVGKPLLYGTTKEFLEIFSLKALSSLPTLKNIKELEAGEVDDSQLSLL
ncbi:SMC-Scp complex subunit ScpB [Thermodesulfobacteriota bacterium]